MRTSGWLQGVSVRCQITQPHRPCIRFLSVKSDFCLRLPPDLASRRRPCLRLPVPTIRAWRGLPPPRFAPCLAHNNNGPPSGRPAITPHRSACPRPRRQRGARTAILFPGPYPAWISILRVCAFSALEDDLQTHFQRGLDSVLVHDVRQVKLRKYSPDRTPHAPACASPASYSTLPDILISSSLSR